MHVVIRRYRNAPKLMDLMEQQKAEIERLNRDVSGFVAYYLVRTGDSGTSVTVCRDRIAAEESTRLAADWFTENAEDIAPAPPEITEGEAVIQFGA
jgi:hypothetical protein